MHRKKIDYILLLSIIIISLFGLLMIYSSSYVWAEYKFNNPFKFVINQAIFLLIGLIIMYFISNIDYHLYQKKQIYYYLVVLSC